MNNYQIEKSLASIAWDVPESVYRADPALSYSTLARYEREGFDRLGHLFDQVSTPSLTFGSTVDTILTDGWDAFNERFTVLDVNITDSGKDVCKKLVSMHLPYSSFEEIPELTVSYAAKEAEFWKADKWDKIRYREVLKTGNVAEYYNALLHVNKTIISQKEYDDALACVKALKESPATSGYFADNDDLSPVRRYYQLKFKARFDGVDYRVMADLIVVDYEKKIIYPSDLKTSIHTEWNFEESFRQWQYMVQSRLYWRVIKANLMNDPYFKDFKLMDYRFIVANRFTLTPLVWEFPYTQYSGTLVDEEGKEYRDPFVIGKELRGYLDLKPQVPNGISVDGVNIIKCLKPKTVTT